MCLCDCGKIKSILGYNLKTRKTKSCGCLQKEEFTKRLTKHGHTKTKEKSRTYNVWKSMNQRCVNPNNKSYPYYGGRGIKVCLRWRKFENFFKDMNDAPIGYQIDRINNNANYCKSNCRWSTRKQQQRNKRNNQTRTFRGKTQCLAAWAEEFNVNISTLQTRLQKGWSIKRTLTTPTRRKK